MPNLNSIESAYLIVALLVPGFVFSVVRSQFLSGHERAGAEYLVRYITYSAVILLIVSPIIWWLDGIKTGPGLRAIIWVAALFVFPALLGFLTGLGTKFGWIAALKRFLHMPPIHAMPTAWDWKFCALGEAWIIVETKSEGKWAGYLGKNSFISSDPSQRDLYVESVFKIDEHDQWHAKNSSVWIAATEISTIEFFPVNRQEKERQVEETVSN